MKYYIEAIKISKEPGKHKTTVYAFKGFVQNINAIIGPTNQIFDIYDTIDKLPTRRFNQDILENMFSLVRSKGGNNLNLSPQEFNNALKFLMNMKIIVPEIKRKAGNCAFDRDLEHSYSNTDLTVEDIRMSETILESVHIEETNENTFNISEVQLLENKIDDGQVINVITYFVSYVTNKIIERIKCEECCSHFLRDKNIIIPREYLLNIKFESKAQTFSAASTKFFELCKMYIQHFQQTFLKRIHLKCLKENYIRECIELTNKIDSSWYAETNNCYNHRIKALNFLLLILVRKNCQWILDEKKSIYTN